MVGGKNLEDGTLLISTATASETEGLLLMLRYREEEIQSNVSIPKAGPVVKLIEHLFKMSNSL